MTDTLITVVTYASFVIAGAVVALNGIAPLTKTEKDNRVLGALRWVQDKILAVILPAIAKRAAK